MELSLLLVHSNPLPAHLRRQRRESLALSPASQHLPGSLQRCFSWWAMWGETTVQPEVKKAQSRQNASLGKPGKGVWPWRRVSLLPCQAQECGQDSCLPEHEIPPPVSPVSLSRRALPWLLRFYSSSWNGKIKCNLLNRDNMLQHAPTRWMSKTSCADCTAQFQHILTHTLLCKPLCK